MTIQLPEVPEDAEPFRPTPLPTAPDGRSIRFFVSRKRTLWLLQQLSLQLGGPVTYEAIRLPGVRSLAGCLSQALGNSEGSQIYSTLDNMRKDGIISYEQREGGRGSGRGHGRGLDSILIHPDWMPPKPEPVELDLTDSASEAQEDQDKPRIPLGSLSFSSEDLFTVALTEIETGFQALQTAKELLDYIRRQDGSRDDEIKALEATIDEIREDKRRYIAQLKDTKEELAKTAGNLAKVRRILARVPVTDRELAEKLAREQEKLISERPNYKG